MILTIFSLAASQPLYGRLLELWSIPGFTTVSDVPKASLSLKRQISSLHSSKSIVSPR